MFNKHQMPWWYLAALLAANLVLLLPNASPLRVAGALLLIGLLPGLSWANRLLATSTMLLRWTAAVALSYVLTHLATLLLHYLPGPAQTWSLLAVLNSLAILPIIGTVKVEGNFSLFSWLPGPPACLLILFLALLLRTVNLPYSEFQGDEALAMITAAEALEGHEDALFLRSKGPGEVLMPMALWRLTGTINEPMARLPFTVAALLAVVTLYLIGQAVDQQRLGWLAAVFFAFNGFMVAFGRIVQYQALVVWMSAMAFLMTVQWRKTGQQRFVMLGGFYLGSGLLAHYDAILVLPAVAWLFLPGSGELKAFIASLKSAWLFLITFLLTALPFYLPYSLDPQANRTGDYVGQRIGNELRNNLPAFFHFNSFYSSAYYIILTGLLVLGLLAWFLWQTKWRYRWVSVLLVASVLAVTFNPNLLAGETLNLSVLPFVLLLVGAFFSLSRSNFQARSGPVRSLPVGQSAFWPLDCSPARANLDVLSLFFSSTTTRLCYQALIVWLAVPFIGYNFVVALGLTHIYTIVPAWSLLAGLAWYYLFDWPQRGLTIRWPAWVSTALLSGWLILTTVFLWNAFIRHDIEYWQDYPAGNLRFFWTPYDQPPGAGFFGFAHRAGWKAIGQKITTGELAGDYSSNEEPDVTTWYTRGAPRACDPQPEFYFLATDLVDPLDVPAEMIESNYEKIGQVTLPNQKQMQIMQQRPRTVAVGELNEPVLAREFDRTATPAVFARSARGSVPIAVNFGNLVHLIGYDLDLGRAYPGGRVPVTLYWQAAAPIPASYQVFTHLESDRSGLVAQADGVPVCWSYPTDLWRPGQIIADQHAILIPPDVPPGDYPLQVGLYLADTFERLDILDEAGNPAGTSVTLTIVEIRSQ